MSKPYETLNELVEESSKSIPKTFDQCYEEIAAYLSKRGIGSFKMEGDPVFELAKTYADHESRTLLETEFESHDHE